MNFAAIANLAMMLLCIAVLLQSIRLMRALKSVRDGGLAQVIEALDVSTQQARIVLSDLKLALGNCAATTAIVGQGKDMADELGVMIGIANASADRLVEAASGANRPDRTETQSESAVEMAVVA